jgi:hypothetical protein
MGKTVLRFVIITALTALIGGVVVAIIGWINKWDTSVQFSNAFFYGGVILMGIGLVSVLGMRGQDTNTARQFSQVVDDSRSEQFNLLRKDIASGYYKMAFFGTAGLLLFGIAWLVLKLF